MRTLEQRALARANEIIDASNIDSDSLKEAVRRTVSTALDTHQFDEALAIISEQTNPKSSDKGNARHLLARIVNALDTRWLMAQAAGDD